MDPKNHPAITVTNIRNFIPFTLEMENGQFTSWAELFRIHCRAFQVGDHIDASFKPPSKTPSSSTATEADKTKAASEFETWSRLDAIVLQWIYSTISNDLLHTILKPNTTASQAWTALENIFQDNQSTRAVYLDSKFVSTRLDHHPNISSYCQAMKMLADQLANVGNPVSNQRLVLQLIVGLNESYEGVAMIIQQTTPLPDFYDVRSKLIMEEARKAHQAAATAVSPTSGTSATALTASTPGLIADILIEYSEKVTKLGCSLFELISEVLGLASSCLKDIGCADRLATICHYYSAYPQPKLTIGTQKHAYNDLVTVLLQDHMGILQFLHKTIC
ncbi:hypothetical protein L2E82_22154 [Cichorium intybus]|uniref:Uncharacterized protein n=1 Tax=Cichorium intybus TaxID=13427 RepID=A0ACB9DXD3_CICIN|nr:hypothetical protein L2E82_22154 [Cichorium intybus]